MPNSYQRKSKALFGNGSTASLLAIVMGAAGLWACSPTVKLAAPDKPIVINLNVNISHEIKVKIDRDLDNLLDKKKGLF